MAGCVQTPAVFEGKLKHAPQTMPRLACLPHGTQFEFDELSSMNSDGRELSAASLFSATCINLLSAGWSLACIDTLILLGGRSKGCTECPVDRDC